MRPLAYIRAPEFVHEAVAVHRDPHDLLGDEGEVLDAVGGVGGQRPGGCRQGGMDTLEGWEASVLGVGRGRMGAWNWI